MKNDTSNKAELKKNVAALVIVVLTNILFLCPGVFEEELNKETFSVLGWIRFPFRIYRMCVLQDNALVFLLLFYSKGRGTTKMDIDAVNFLLGW